MAEHKLNSIHDLAREAGVSYGTVSRVLNGRGRASDETRQKVLAVAKSFNFKPRMQAKRATVGLAFNSDSLALGNEYWTSLISCIVKQLSFHDACVVEFFSTHNITRLRSALLDGLICLPWDANSNEFIGGLPEGIPLVIPNAPGPSNCSSVMADHHQGGWLAADCLRKNAHTAAGIIVCGSGRPIEERINGFRGRFSSDGLEVDPRAICDLTKDSLQDSVDRILQRKATALFFATEGKTAEFASLMRKRGLKIPDDFSLVAMESWEFSKFQDPPYTTIQQPYDLIAAKTVELILAKMASGDCAPEHVLLDNRLLERDSVRDLSGRREA